MISPLERALMDLRYWDALVDAQSTRWLLERLVPARDIGLVESARVVAAIAVACARERAAEIIQRGRDWDGAVSW